MRKVIEFLFENSVFLVIGAAVGLVWANLDEASYHDLVHAGLLEGSPFGELEHGNRVLTLHYLVNHVMMAFFFAIAAKEVWEAMLPGGPLRSPRKAAVPLLATLGGMLGPALVYLLGAVLLGELSQYGSGWAIPCATDIAFSYMVARLVFGDGHPAIPFLLLLAIADDALGLIILAVFYPQEEVRVVWMLLPAAAVVLGLLLRRFGLMSFWWYLLLPGSISWVGFAMAGLHPALGLLPVIPTMPHAHTDLGFFMASELKLRDTLNEFEHWWHRPVELILGLFGLLNAGVVLAAFGAPTLLVLAGLLVGKPAGICLCGWLGTRLGFSLPEGMNNRDLFVVACAAAIGFTVALFVSVVAFPPGEIQDAAKMGALLSLIAGVLTVVAARLLGVRKIPGHRRAV